MKCIYCLENKPETAYRKTEHVMPQSFGSFKSNFTLKNVVCDECNTYFGDNLEVNLARDTYEGQSRYEYEIKKPEDYKSRGKKSRLVIRVSEGQLKGIYVYREYSTQRNKILLKPLPQVGFKKSNSDEYEYFLFDSVPEKQHFENDGYDFMHSHGIRSFGIDEPLLERKLRERGFSLKPTKEEFIPSIEHGLLQCEIDGTIDRIIFRAIAKIGFNYLAFWQDSDFIHQDSFHQIRRYIRYGETTSYPLVQVFKKPILADEKSNRRRLGHLITVNWASDKMSIVSQVSLFNWITYGICLAREYVGDYSNIKKGHFFNIRSKDILQLG
ncbi:MAG: HNH endonuclease [Nitrospirota bacterium]